MKIVERPSPNFNERVGVAGPDILIMHYTGMQIVRGGGRRLTTRRRGSVRTTRSTRTGRSTRHVPEAMRAWHAGVSSWRGATDINSRSIGIEIVNPGHEFGYRAFPEAQIEAVIGLEQSDCRAACDSGTQCDRAFRHRAGPQDRSGRVVSVEASGACGAWALGRGESGAGCSLIAGRCPGVASPNFSRRSRFRLWTRRDRPFRRAHRDRGQRLSAAFPAGEIRWRRRCGDAGAVARVERDA